ncbi:hypothetical protein IW140_000933 [Coemansia sp. RSA 1813]|nr:hypothetical protein EV178_001346 [Coemansia sp. RSA 1646]KAJ1772902.1 hypothetical protein LPJ74_001040 [Coemansia sp. RSA 1843]KAJ2093474.1 hypothetical protein IW138_000324 [Coemansia sp. RSA 986]KAJ2572482.1 hypothetical protein IW140_000933 [Coemansia sp. RSA 1813]
MVSFSTCVASFMALAAAVNAGFYTTYPVGADSVNSGQTITIKWNPDEQQPLLDGVKTYTLKFMTGGNIVQTTVATIGDFDISKHDISFTIPTTAPGMYFLMYTADNGAGSSWSTRFSVNGGTTWYPDGVATGVDPGTSSSSGGGDIGEPTQITATKSETPSSSSKSDSAPSSSDEDTTPSHSTSSKTASTPAKPTDDSSSANTGSSGGSDNGNGGNGGNGGDNNGGSNNNNGASDATNDDTGSADDTNSAESSDDSAKESNSEESESLDSIDSSPESSGASAVNIISVAAAVAGALALFY